ncbi:MAG: hypothetical protein WD063_20695 [Pirellulales bacterium]
MKTLVLAFAFVIWSATTALAGDLAVTKSTLDSMGLAGMQQLSDHDGLAVRGKGPFDGVLGGLFPGWQLGNDPSPPPSPIQPESPFDSSPFGGRSLLDNFQGGSQHFGTGASVFGNTMGFGGTFPWPL